jgi:hypothetical protein
MCSTFIVDLYPIVHRRYQDHIFNRVRNLCIIISKGCESLAPSYECCAHDHHAVSRGAFLSFLRQGLSLTNSAGGTLTLAFFMTTQRKKRNHPLATKGEVLIAISPSLQYQGLAIKPKPSVS